MIGTTLGLNSNGGIKGLRFDVTDSLEYEGATVAVCSVRLWHRTYSDVPDEDLEAALTASSVLVSIPSLSAFRDAVEVWLALPLPDQAVTPLAASVSLRPEWEPSRLDIDIAPRADTIAERHPVATVRYGFGALRGDLAMVVDQSCWRRFCDQSGFLITNAGSHASTS